MELGDIKLSWKLKGIDKDLDISEFCIVEYSVRSERGHFIALQDQEYDVPGLPKSLHIIHPKYIFILEG